MKTGIEVSEDNGVQPTTAASQQKGPRGEGRTIRCPKAARAPFASARSLITTHGECRWGLCTHNWFLMDRIIYPYAQECVLYNIHSTSRADTGASVSEWAPIVRGGRNRCALANFTLAEWKRFFNLFGRDQARDALRVFMGKLWHTPGSVVAPLGLFKFADGRESMTCETLCCASWKSIVCAQKVWGDFRQLVLIYSTRSDNYLVWHFSNQCTVWKLLCARVKEKLQDLF